MIRQRLMFLFVMAAAAVAVLCCGCSDNGIGGAIFEQKIEDGKVPYTTGSFTDSRDGKTYKTTKVGNNKEWMAQNLNYDTANGSWCYENHDYNCDKYGRLYDWWTATKVCPSGWHLPSRQEWDNLVSAVGSLAGVRLKAKSGWNNGGNGSDDVEFSALPGGFRYSYGYFDTAGGSGRWWTATEGGDDGAYGRSMRYNYDYVDEYDYYYDLKYSGYSVRCVKD